ncbi:TetR/AcrR family transcriptional regulator [Notoacmeibacter sp. MSK16QG-6]|uniref:TetR/AcrR family transcriptional regulator n=1 Tax=Notoacmeibacter sp. MSK16QG-6 TaxID=2957982 RepID=UPI00209E4C39|nr:TetR/AcrR family transcriptional regulator [Notoacmeibacter sp. MSK16QG-6]MCP1200980.1 TetR/AcrR family transcriptional regulator [Notoacmeibacter sp. MSK16QG-6]
MGRRSTFDDASVFEALGRSMAGNGNVTLQSIVGATGISIGSLYHRYGSREGLLAQAWLDSLEAFQERFLQAIRANTLQAGENAALATPRFCRDEHDRALILASCRQSEFLSDGTPTRLVHQIAEVNREAFAAVRAFADREGKDLETCQMALIGFPLGAVRMYLPSRKVPKSADEMVACAFRALMGHS